MTKIWIYAKSPFKSDYANVLHFENELEQNKFFEDPTLNDNSPVSFHKLKAIAIID